MDEKKRKCADCDNVCGVSPHTKKMSKRCLECLEKCRERSRKSYHRRHARDSLLNTAHGEVARRNKDVWKLKRDIAELKERLSVAQRRLRASNESNAELRRALAEAIVASNSDDQAALAKLPSAISVRNESEVLEILRTVDENTTTLRAQRQADFEEFRHESQTLMQEVKDMMDRAVMDMESVFDQQQRRRQQKSSSTTKKKTKSSSNKST